MKKNHIEKIIKSIGVNAEVLLSDDGDYYVRYRHHDIVSLPMREVIDGIERFVDKWAIYSVDEHGDRDSTYKSLHDSIMIAVHVINVVAKLEIVTESSDGVKYYDLRTLDKPFTVSLVMIQKELEKAGYKEFVATKGLLTPNRFVL